MSLDTCFDALRFLSRSSELEATRLMTAELRINELLEQVKLKPAAQRALLAALNAEQGSFFNDVVGYDPLRERSTCGGASSSRC